MAIPGAALMSFLRHEPPPPFPRAVPPPGSTAPASAFEAMAVKEGHHHRATEQL